LQWFFLAAWTPFVSPNLNQRHQNTRENKMHWPQSGKITGIHSSSTTRLLSIWALLSLRQCQYPVAHSIFLFPDFAKVWCFQCFVTVGWAAGMASSLQKTEWWDAGVVVSGQGADLHMAQLMLLALTFSYSSKSRLVLPSWFNLSVPAHPGCPRCVWFRLLGICLHCHHIWPRVIQLGQLQLGFAKQIRARWKVVEC